MKSYCSIAGIKQGFKSHENEPCFAFYKYDGSCLRFEWSQKKKWHKFGTRHHLFDESDKEYGRAIEIFNKTYASDLEKIFQDNKEFKSLERVVVFCEFFGPSSFGGWHNFNDKNEKFELCLFDVDIHKKGILLPSDFLKHFGHLRTAEVLYEGPFTKEFVNKVIYDNLEYELGEGVVVKGGKSQHKLWMTKVKTKKWLEELKTKAEKFKSLAQVLSENQQEQSFG